MDQQIRLLQFLICRDFRESGKDAYLGEGVLSNYFVGSFPAHLKDLFAVTCWRKDQKFHKEVIEYETEAGLILKSAHMDIEPITDAVYFRWHKHSFPPDLIIEKSSYLTIRVILDWKPMWETSILIEKRIESPLA